MNSNQLTARLLATSSLAALVLAGAASPVRAANPCPGATYTAAPFPNGLTNSANLACILVNPTASTVITGSIVNTATGTIGPSHLSSGAIVLTSTATLGGAIINAGTITGAASGTRSLGIGDFGLVTGGISNSGTIKALITNAGSHVNATGIEVSASSFGGGITNSGTISAAGSGTEAAPTDPAGIFIAVSTFDGNLVTSGTIAATAIATGAGDAALATGILAFVSSFNGSITNSGTITAGATAAGGGGEANAFGISVDASIFSGGITNSGMIDVNASASSGFAVATGISVIASSFAGSVSNSGTIIAAASGSVAAHLVPAGIFVGVATFDGGVVNSGAIAAIAVATGVSALATGIDVDVGSISGAIVNSGTITADATLTGSGGSARAAGLVAGADFIGGGISNSGTILVVTDAVSAFADATGIAAFATLLVGGITNSGSISVSGTGTSAGALRPFGILVELTSFVGNLSNSGTIAVTALATGTNSGEAAATTIFVSADSIFTGAVVNSGTMTAAATASAGGGLAQARGIFAEGTSFVGGLTNGGVISAIARITPGNDCGEALAVGVFVDATGLGSVSNSGTISVAASVSATVGGNLARATGMTIFAQTLGGGVGNSGSISVVSTLTGDGQASAVGMEVVGSTLLGGISNGAGGVIAASATQTNASAAGLVGATGVFVDGGSVVGNIVNNGTITAQAAGGASPALALGPNLFIDTLVGSVSNSGTISATVNHGSAIGVTATGFSATIVNSGTIMGTVTGATGTGMGIRIRGFGAGTIVNSGLIEGSSWAISLEGFTPSVIDQNAGTLVGGSGGAIRFSGEGDTLNINGGAIAGNVTGTGGTLATVNVQPGSGKTFAYGNAIAGVGAVNLNSGTFLLRNSASTGTAGTVDAVSFTENAGATLGFEVTPVSGAPGVAGTGSITAPTITLNGTVEAFHLIGAYGPANSVFTYSGLTSSSTASVAASSFSPIFTAAFNGATGTLTLTELPASAVPGLNPAQQGVLTALQNTPQAIGADLLFTLGPQQLGTALTSVLGEQNTETTQLVGDSWQNFTDMLLDRLFSGGSGGATVGSFTPGNGVQFAQAAQAATSSMSDASPRSAATPWGAWARGYSLGVNASASAAAAPYRESRAGILFGADHPISDALIAGIAVDLGTDKASFSGGGQTLVDSYQGAAYANYAIDPNWYVNGVAGFSWQSFSSARLVTVSTTSIANSSYSGQGYRAYAETGYALHPAFPAAAGAKIAPYLALGYLHTHNDAYVENGSPFALSVGAVDADSLTSTLGARASLVWRVGETVFRPELRAAWQHEWLDNSTSVRSSFAQAPANLFTTTGAAFSREAFIGGVGISSDVSQATQLFVDYDARVSGGYTAQVVSGGLRVAF